MSRPRIGIHKLTSCSGCQAVFLNLGEELLTLSQLVEISHFIEAGVHQPDCRLDIAFVEGSITTPEDEQRLRRVRENSEILVAIGACACSGGVQALRNVKNSSTWPGAIYPNLEFIDTLADSRAVADVVKVELELWGCPISGHQLLITLRSLLSGVIPALPTEKVCQECKRAGNVCILVSRGVPCLGPVTRAGCGALCPTFDAPCYTCFGPSEQPNTQSLAQRLIDLGIPPQQVAERFVSISSGAKPFQEIWHKHHASTKGDPK